LHSGTQKRLFDARKFNFHARKFNFHAKELNFLARKFNFRVRERHFRAVSKEKFAAVRRCSVSFAGKFAPPEANGAS
jgi:hypothetical protein